MKKLFLYTGLIFIASCNFDLDSPAPQQGEADLSCYLAVGSSHTAGYADGSLYREAQENSFPNLLAMQFTAAGGGSFKQPLLPGESGWPINPLGGFNPKRQLEYYTDCKGVVELNPNLVTAPFDTAGSSENIAVHGPFNNAGIPGIRVIDFSVPLYGGLNPYSARFLEHAGTARPIDDILSINPSFFTLWAGVDDVMGYMLAGGEGAGAGIMMKDITGITAFQPAYDSLVNALTASGAKGVLMNIPDLTATPFLNTIPIDGLELTAEEAKDLNAQYALNGIHFTEGKNHFVIREKTLLGLPGTPRKIKDGEKLMLTVPLDSIKCYGWGKTVPIPSRYVLDLTELSNMRSAILAFNNVIAQAANKHDLGLTDMYSFLKTVNAGINFNGVNFTATYATGGFYSLDGIHFTPRGNALTANEVIKTINRKYKASISWIDANTLKGIVVP